MQLDISTVHNTHLCTTITPRPFSHSTRIRDPDTGRRFYRSLSPLLLLLCELWSYINIYLNSNMLCNFRTADSTTSDAAGLGLTRDINFKFDTLKSPEPHYDPSLLLKKEVRPYTTLITVRVNGNDNSLLYLFIAALPTCFLILQRLLGQNLQKYLILAYNNIRS